MVMMPNRPLPTAEIAKIFGCSLTATQRTPKPRRITPAVTGRVTALQASAVRTVSQGRHRHVARNSSPHRVAGVPQGRFDLTDRERAEVEDAGRQHGVRAGFDRGRE